MSSLRAEVIIVTENRPEALARLGVFAGEWVLEARFRGGGPALSAASQEGPQVRSRFEWTLDGQFLLQRTHDNLSLTLDGDNVTLSVWRQ